MQTMTYELFRSNVEPKRLFLSHYDKTRSLTSAANRVKKRFFTERKRRESPLEHIAPGITFNKGVMKRLKKMGTRVYEIEANTYEDKRTHEEIMLDTRKEVAKALNIHLAATIYCEVHTLKVASYKICGGGRSRRGEVQKTLGFHVVTGKITLPSLEIEGLMPLQSRPCGVHEINSGEFNASGIEWIAVPITVRTTDGEKVRLYYIAEYVYDFEKGTDLLL